MLTVNPGQTTTLTESGIPTGSSVGFQVIKAATNSVAIARTTAGVIERPVGSGNYVINFIAPVEGDLYLVVIDYTAGVIDTTARVKELQVTLEVQPGSSGMGAVADYAKMWLGSATWRGLQDDPDYGMAYINQAITVVKARVITTPPDTAGESSLHPLVLDYLGICVALALIPAARDHWMQAEISRSVGNDPMEVVTYANRAALMDELQNDLMKRLPAAQAGAIPLVPGPVLRLASGGPAIDEDDDCKVTANPRTFPTAVDFPGERLFLDAFGYPTRIRARRSGVLLP